MQGSTGSAIAATALAAGAVFLLAWARQRRTRDATSVDLLWTLGVGAAVALHAALGQGWLPRRLLVVALVWTWAARLSWHLMRRQAALSAAGSPAEPAEDGRYAHLRRAAGERAGSAFLLLYVLQAALVVGLASCFLPLLQAEAPGWRASDAVAVVVFGAALLGESAADRQLQRWRADPAQRGRTCRVGLWRLSRHPNYVFEWLHWFTYPLLAWGLPRAGLTWLAPLSMYLLIRFVSGVPPAEAQALRSRGDDYREYQRTTPVFLPLPRRLCANPT